MLQSRFRKITVAVLHATDVVICQVDKRKITALTLSDSSMAFDRIHHILLLVLHFVGLSINAVSLLENYLTNRLQRVTKIVDNQIKLECCQVSLKGLI